MSSNVSSADDGSIAGIDRWRGGWIIARQDRAEGAVELAVANDATAAIDLTSRSRVVAVDMPMALPVEGQRAAEQELRKALGSSARSVFTSPTRAAIGAASQSEATELNRANGGPGISAQAWGLAGSIRELRSTLASHPNRQRWFETHPETAFALLNGGPALASKRSARGVGERLQLLRPILPKVDQLLVAAPLKVPVDDVLDALAALWSANRIANAAAQIFGAAGRDDEGFEGSIRV